MQKRQLGRSGLQVAPLMFGGNVFGWTIDEAVSFQLLDAFAGAGFNFIDTADAYSRWAPGNQGGESEAIIGKWMKQRGNRDKIIVATKVGSDMGQGKNITKKYILVAADASLRRLQTDYIDLYQTHFDDDVTPVEETLEAYSVLLKAGKIRAIGASNLSPARLKASLEASARHGYPRYESFQPHYNLMEREIFEKELETVMCGESSGRYQLLVACGGFSDWQIPVGGRSKQEPAGVRGEEIFESARASGSGRVGCRGRGIPFDAGKCGDRVADRAAFGDGADRQRHESGAAGFADRCDETGAKR